MTISSQSVTISSQSVDISSCESGKTHEEYWISAEDLEEFNLNIVCKIEVTAEFKG